MNEIRDYHWRYVAEEGENNKNICALIWEAYFKEKEDSIKREFPVSISHTKGEDIVWTYVKDNIIKEK